MKQKDFGALIKSIRKENNLTQKELAEKYHVTYQAVSKWENGKNMPDISLIKKISSDYNISIDNLLKGNNKKKTNKNIYLIVLIIILLLTIIILLLFQDNNYEFKHISSNCDEFNLNGSIAYNKNKSSIYISDIEYCKEDNKKMKYKKIECTLYETNLIDIRKIGTYEKSNISLDDFLNNISLSYENENNLCKKFTNTSLYLEINATKDDDSIQKYNIPLKLNENCND